MAPDFYLASSSQIQGENLLKLKFCCKSNLECPMFIFVNTFQQHFVCLDYMYFGQFCLTELNCQQDEKGFLSWFISDYSDPKFASECNGLKKWVAYVIHPRQVNRPQNAPSLNTKCENTKVGKYRNGPHICHIQWNILNQPQNIIKSQKGNFLRPNQNSLHTDTT